MRLLDRQRKVAQTVLEPMRSFVRAETAGGLLLVLAAVAGFTWANSQFSDSYDHVWELRIALGVGPVGVEEDLRHWINDGLMTVFFFVVGLEIKRELVTGELREWRAASLPLLAAVGGALLPVAVFLAIVGPGVERDGWGVPMATDIAFAIAVIAALGQRVPWGARIFLVSLAIVDDVLAISVIGLFYSSSIHAAWLLTTVLGLSAVAVMRRAGICQIWWYAALGLGIWYATYQSGVHPTIAGVALALLTPATRYHGRDVLGQLERRLHPISSFLVVPAFGLANAGVDIGGGLLAEAAGSHLAWGVAAGLFAGKLLGIAGVTFLAVRLKVAVLPSGVTHRHVWGVSALAGIGFTVSLFIADLAYEDAAMVELAKLGVFAASLAAGAVGALLLVLAGNPDRDAKRGTDATTHRDDPATRRPATTADGLRHDGTAAGRRRPGSTKCCGGALTPRVG